MKHSEGTKSSTLLTVVGLIAVASLLVGFQPRIVLADENSFIAAHTFVTFDAPDAGNGKGQGTVGAVIASDGWVTGWYYDSNSVVHGFLRSPSGGVAEFDPPGSVGTFPKSMNSKLAIVGYYTDSNGVYHGFGRSPQGTLITLDDPEAGNSPGQGTFALSMNTIGKVVGYYLDSNSAYHGFLRTPGGNFIGFDVPGAGTGQYQGTQPASTDGLAYAGAVTGTYTDSNSTSHGFARPRDGGFITFDPAGSLGTYTAGINSKREIAGLYVDLDGSHGFVRERNGTITSFDVLSNPPGFSVGTINDAGTIVGWYIDSKQVAHGYVRHSNGQIAKLDVPGAGTGRNQGTFPFANSSAGLITGVYLDSSSVYHGFLGR